MSKEKLLASYARSLQDRQYYFETKMVEAKEDIKLEHGTWHIKIEKGAMLPGADVKTLAKHFYMNYLINKAYLKKEITLQEIENIIKGAWENKGVIR